MEQKQLKNIRRYLSQSEGKEAARQKKLDRARHISKEMKDYKFSRLNFDLSKISHIDISLFSRLSRYM